jgi:excisionase family DNA binding protein
MERSRGPAPIAVGVQGAADLMGAPPSTVRMWCARGLVPAVKIGQRWRIRLDVLDAISRTGCAPEELSARGVPVAGQ